jgi:hypothetical protein
VFSPASLICRGEPGKFFEVKSDVLHNYPAGIPEGIFLGIGEDLACVIPAKRRI